MGTVAPGRRPQGAGGDNRGEAGVFRGVPGVEGLGQRAALIGFQQHGVGRTHGGGIAGDEFAESQRRRHSGFVGPRVLQSQPPLLFPLPSLLPLLPPSLLGCQKRRRRGTT